jgi:hypothetical protein
MTSQTMPEPPDGAFVALKAPSGKGVTAFFERDDSALTEPHDDHWYDSSGDAWWWTEVVEHARKTGRELHRLYLRDDLPTSVAAALDAAERAAVGW